MWAKTWTRVCAVSWLVCLALEVWRPTIVFRLFNPNLWLVGFVVGVAWWYGLAHRTARTLLK